MAFSVQHSLCIYVYRFLYCYYWSWQVTCQDFIFHQIKDRPFRILKTEVAHQRCSGLNIAILGVFANTSVTQWTCSALDWHSLHYVPWNSSFELGWTFEDIEYYMAVFKAVLTATGMSTFHVILGLFCSFSVTWHVSPSAWSSCGHTQSLVMNKCLVSY